MRGKEWMNGMRVSTTLLTTTPVLSGKNLCWLHPKYYLGRGSRGEQIWFQSLHVPETTGNHSFLSPVVSGTLTLPNTHSNTSSYLLPPISSESHQLYPSIISLPLILRVTSTIVIPQTILILLLVMMIRVNSEFNHNPSSQMPLMPHFTAHSCPFWSHSHSLPFYEPFLCPQNAL